MSIDELDGGMSFLLYNVDWLLCIGLAFSAVVYEADSLAQGIY